MLTLDYTSSPPPKPFNALPLKITTVGITYLLLLALAAKLTTNPWRPTPPWLEYARIIGLPVVLVCIYCSLRTLIVACIHEPLNNRPAILALALIFLIGSPVLLTMGMPPHHHMSLTVYMATKARGIGTAVQIHAATNHGHYPPHLAVLLLEGHVPPANLDNPADPHPYSLPSPPPADWHTIAADVDAHSAFIYTAADLAEPALSRANPSLIIVLYSRPSPYLRYRNIVFADGHVETPTNTDLPKIFADSNVARAKIHLPPFTLDGPPPAPPK